jgi:GAF domain-containing protein
MTRAPVPDDLLGVMARSSGRTISDGTVHTLLGLLTAAALRVEPAASGAGLTVEDTGAGTLSVAATDPEVELLDALQYDLDEGPCLTSWRERVVVRVDDISAEHRWPRWCAEARATPVRSSLSAPLVIGDTALGAMKVYGHAPGSFGGNDEAALQLFAAQAAILVAHEQAYRRAGELTENLQQLLRQRDDLNRACGMIMQREGVSAESALTYLMSLADRDRRTVHETATRIVRHAGSGPR